MDNSVSIVKQDVCFNAVGGQGTITVSAPGAITATSSADWCRASVSGNTVNVTADANTNYIGRSAVINISCGSDSRQVSVVQTGIVIDFTFDTQTISVPQPGLTFSIKGRAADPLEVKSNADWVKAAVAADGVVVSVEKNSASSARTATIVLSAPAHDNKAVITIRQEGRTLTAPEGNYRMTFMTKNNDPSTAAYADVVITKSEEANGYLLDMSSVYPGWVLPMTMDSAKKQMVIKNTAFMGYYDNAGTQCYANMLVYYTNGSSLYISYSTDAKYDIFFDYTMDSKNMFNMTLFNSAPSIGTGRTSLGMQVNVFTAPEPIKDNRLGSVMTIIDPKIEAQ